MPKAIGIDLGTTNSAVSVMEGDSAVVITPANAHRLFDMMIKEIIVKPSNP